MSYPSNVSNKTLVIGGGVHAAIFAASWVRAGGDKPVVAEKTSRTGGVFSRLMPFAMNSANLSSLDSAGTGPSRMPRRSAADDLNYLPNSAYQVSTIAKGEYPSSQEMADIVRSTLQEYSDVYVNCDLTLESNGESIYRADTGEYLGSPARVIWAAGLYMPSNSSYDGSPSVVTAESFLSPREGDTGRFMDRQYAGRKIAVVGNGDTAATIIEYLLGQGLSKPTTMADDIDWYGGSVMPMTKKSWAMTYHARYITIARHMPERKVYGVINPIPERGRISPAGTTSYVNGRTYDLVIDATGFRALTPSFDYSYDFNSNATARVIARRTYDNSLYLIGAAAGISGDNVYNSKFAAARLAIYQLAPITAEFATQLYRQYNG